MEKGVLAVRVGESHEQQDSILIKIEGFLGGPVAKYLSAKAGVKSSIPESGRSPVFLSVEFYGQKSLVGYSPWACKESDMT